MRHLQRQIHEEMAGFFTVPTVSRQNSQRRIGQRLQKDTGFISVFTVSQRKSKPRIGKLLLRDTNCENVHCAGIIQMHTGKSSKMGLYFVLCNCNVSAYKPFLLRK
ncbi:hypothetical protein Ddye_002585 [Dipteronia dyeriana]|uniref:Uncharacterized protein n=1 Tax=Dipteronia dyeriana TaxID=168575 RepID=A0AAD9XRA0_9ROSI|nr:hypothetical protein Ddye_002585 [Dipteronia dyeriana]